MCCHFHNRKQLYSCDRNPPVGISSSLRQALCCHSSMDAEPFERANPPASLVGPFYRKFLTCRRSLLVTANIARQMRMSQHTFVSVSPLWLLHP